MKIENKQDCLVVLILVFVAFFNESSQTTTCLRVETKVAVATAPATSAAVVVSERRELEQLTNLTVNAIEVRNHQS